MPVCGARRPICLCWSPHEQHRRICRYNLLIANDVARYGRVVLPNFSDSLEPKVQMVLPNFFSNGLARNHFLGVEAQVRGRHYCHHCSRSRLTNAYFGGYHSLQGVRFV